MGNRTERSRDVRFPDWRGDCHSTCRSAPRFAAALICGTCFSLAGVPDPKPITAWMSDMDGVLVHEGKLIPGADAFVGGCAASGTPFLVLTNNSIYTPRDLRHACSAVA